MSKWWQYQLITTASHRVGGPINLIVLTGLAAVGTTRGAEAGIKKLAKTINQRRDNISTRDKSSATIYIVKNESDFGNGLILPRGTEFQIVSHDGEITLINILGADFNPHVAFTEKLKQSTDYPDA